MGGALYVFNLKAEPMEMLRRSGTFDVIGADDFFWLATTYSTPCTSG